MLVFLGYKKYKIAYVFYTVALSNTLIDLHAQECNLRRPATVSRQ